MNWSQRFLAFVLAQSFFFSMGYALPPVQIESSSSEAIVVDEPSNYSRVFVISDIHGMYDKSLTLLRAGKVIDDNNVWIAGNSLLIVTGDSIDKGAQSIEVIDLMLSLQQQATSVGGRVIHTLGNHEAEFLADPQTNNKKAAELIEEMQSLRIPLSDLTTTSSPRGRFMHTEPVALRVGKWLFCHSGFYPEMSWSDFSTKANHVFQTQNYGSDFLIGDDSILESKKWDQDESTVSDMLGRLDDAGIYGVVFGHQPKAFGVKGRSAAKYKGRLVKIDNGMAPESGDHVGSLLVFVTPTQMNNSAYPSIKIIDPDGTQRTLQPE